MLSVKTISILLVLLTRNIFAYFDCQTNENNTPMYRVWSALKSASTFVISFRSSLNPEEALFRLHFGLAGGELFYFGRLFGQTYQGQSSIKCCSAAAPLRAEQGPCEPSEDVVRKFGEQ